MNTCKRRPTDALSHAIASGQYAPWSSGLEAREMNELLQTAAEEQNYLVILFASRCSFVCTVLSRSSYQKTDCHVNCQIPGIYCSVRYLGVTFVPRYSTVFLYVCVPDYVYLVHDLSYALLVYL